MSKPDWRDAPEWANWMACDEESGWWWYEKEPVLIVDGWVCDSFNAGRVEHAQDAPLNEFYDESLEERP